MGDEDDTKPQRKCRTCKGAGWIVLLTSRSECPDCDGSGISPRNFDDDDHTPPRGLKV